MAMLLADENFPLPVTLRLIELGHDVVTLQQLGHANQKMQDEAVLRLATEMSRAVLTQDRWDFIRLHRASQAHGGIVACTPDACDALASRIDRQVGESEPLAGKLVRVKKPST